MPNGGDNSFRLPVGLYACSSVALLEFATEFYVKVSQMGTSQLLLVGKHSNLGHVYLGGSAYIP